MSDASTTRDPRPATSEANKALVNRFVAAVWNGEDLAAIDALATEELLVHGLGAGVDRDRDRFVAFHGGLLDAVPDLTHRVDRLVAEDSRVIAVLSIRGTPERQYGALAPTGASFDSVAFQEYRIDDGAIAEVWVLPNAMGMLRQLGVFPDSPGAVLRLLLRAGAARIRWW